MSLDVANRQLMGSGKPSISWANAEVGTTVKGTILDADVTQQTDFKSREPKTWPDGQPMMQVVITLQTELRDPSVIDDDGQRRLFVDGKRITEAVRDACRAANVKGLDVGGTLAVKFTGLGEAPGPGLSAPKLFRAEYKPAPTAVGESLV